MQARKLNKLYYSIGEVSEITGLKQYVLRYWETEFSQLSPSKNRAGNRNYKEFDVNLILEIKELLYKRKFTIKGAKQHLKDKHENSNVAKEKSNVLRMNSSEDSALLNELKNIKKGLSEILKTIEDLKK